MLHILSSSFILAALTAIITCDPIPLINGVTAAPTMKRDGENHMRNTGRYPYMVSIQKSTSRCAGVLVKDNVVLTAAHCTLGQGDLKITAGALDLDLPGRKQVRIAKSVTRHSNYSKIYPLGNSYDIAVLRVAPKFILNDLVSTIKLTNRDYVGASAFVIGWGMTERERYSHLLLRAGFKILSAEKCRDKVEPKAMIPFTDSMLCAQHPKNKQTTCQGDSGAPLVVRSLKGFGPNVLVGLTSWGVFDKSVEHGCDTNYPCVFVRITRVKSWIKDVTGM